MKGDNRLELLLFHLGSQQQFGINVLKVKEILDCPPLRQLPNSHSSVCGIAQLRGESLSVIDLSKAIGRTGQYADKANECSGSIIITEFNRTMQGFLVERVDRIVVREWKDILPPSGTLGATSFMTGVTDVDGQLVQILDVENILSNVSPIDILTLDVDTSEIVQGTILIVDDSALARKQIAETLDAINLPYIITANGKEALELLKKCNVNSTDDNNLIAMVVSDIEMPEMDGYTLTTNIRKDPRLSDLYVVLSSSLSGGFNDTLTEKVGANKFMSKWHPEELAQAIIDRIDAVATQRQKQAS